MPMIDRVLLMSSTVEAAAYTAGSVAGVEDGGSVLTCFPAFSAVVSWSPAVMVPSATDSCTGPKPDTVTRPLAGVSAPAMPVPVADGAAGGAAVQRCAARRGRVPPGLVGVVRADMVGLRWAGGRGVHRPGPPAALPGRNLGDRVAVATDPPAEVAEERDIRIVHQDDAPVRR